MTKEVRIYQWAKDNLLNNWYWKSWTTMCKSMKLEHIYTPHTKINSKWLKSLNIRHDILSPLEENIGKTLWHKSYQYFLRLVSQRNRNKNKDQKMGPNQMYKLLHSKGNHQQNEKATYRLGENICNHTTIFAKNDTTKKSLISKINKQLIQLSN